MKRYIKEIIVSLLQIFMFYVFPLFAGATDAMGMVVTIILATLFLSFIIGVLSNNALKYLYPIVTAVVFIPSVFIYYNESALIHSIWYLAVSVVGVLIGSGINAIVCRLKQRKK